MDPSNTSSMNGSHLQQQYSGGSSYSHFINDIEVFAQGDESVSGNDEYTNFSWDPALFAENDSNSSFPQHQQQQQQSSMPVNLNQTLTRQSNSPALQQHHPSQSQYPHGNYGHALYDSRNMPQPSFDDRFMSRPSASPAPFDAPPNYQQMPYNGYGYQQQYQRQSSTPTPFYNQRPLQQSQPLLNIAARPSPQLPQTQQMDNNMPFHQYPNSQRLTHTFVNPSMVNSSQLVAMNGNQQQNNSQATPQQPSQSSAQPQQQQQQYQSSPYFQKAGSTVDPQILHAMQMQNYPPHPANAQHILQQPSAASQSSNTQFSSVPIYAANQQFLPQHDMSQSKPTKDPNAPKKPRTKANKVKKDGGVESDSSDGLEIEEEPEPKPALLIVTPPTDEKGRALYNAVEAVWFPRNRSPPAEDVRKGIAAFGETVRALRDAWKAKNELLKKAELDNSDTASQAPRLKEDVAHYRQTMESVMTRCFQLGHDAIVKRLGENQFTLSALYSFLLDRHYVGDYDSTLVSGIFKFAAKFETLDEEMLEQVKWTKLLQKWTKKATNESKVFAQKILSNAATASARKKAAKADGGPGSPASVNGIKNAGVKRAREVDGANAPAPKKIVKPASKPLALQSAERRRALEKENKEKASGAKTDKGPGSTVPSRPKVAMTAPPKPSAFASLLSASKKPGTSNAEKAAAAAAAVKEKGTGTPATTLSVGSVVAAKKEETKRESPPRGINANGSKSASSFLGFLADMDKPKETEPKKADVDPNETEEQRTKRLRKEARRKLRVTWKPDSDLVQTKIFTHDPEEETGQTDNMMRDAGDTMKEGEMLKRHMAMDDVDEDEEEEEPLDDLAEYSPPSEVDFSVIDAERGGNFIKLGGPGEPESLASEAQTKYEENTLMTTYTFKSDRPETPKELPSVTDDDDDFSPALDFGEPDDKVRRREKDIIARKMPQVTAAPATDLAAQLRALGSQPVQQPPLAQPPNINSSIFGQQPSQPANTQQSATPDLSKLLAVMQQFGQLQQTQQPPPPQPAPVPVPVSVPAYQPAPSSNIPPNLAAIMAQLSGSQNSSLPLGNAGNPNPFPGNADFGRKHGRAEESHDQANKKKKKGTTDGKPYNYKTVTCQFWVEGKCTKGDNCTYKHEL